MQGTGDLLGLDEDYNDNKLPVNDLLSIPSQNEP